MKRFLPSLCLGSALLLSSCNVTLVPLEGGVDRDAALSQFVSGSGVSILTAGAVEATVYHYIKREPRSIETFLDVQNKLVSDFSDRVLTPAELKDSIKMWLQTEKSPYRTYAMMALDVIFAAYQSTSDVRGVDVSQYNAMIDAVILGIGDAIELYEMDKQ